MTVGPDVFLTFGSATAALAAVCAALVKWISSKAASRNVIVTSNQLDSKGQVIKIELNASGATAEQLERIMAALKPLDVEPASKSAPPQAKTAR